MLRFDPSQRLTIDAALAHPYLASVRNESKELKASAPMSDAIESIGEDQDHLHANVSTPTIYDYLTVFFDYSPFCGGRTSKTFLYLFFLSPLSPLSLS